MASVVSASDVVAVGQLPQHIQFPSPIYFSQWISESFVLLGAGGGGKRFGMANLVALLSVAESTASCGTAKAEANEQQLTWKFEDAIDIGDSIPWCSTPFTSCMIPSNQRKGAHNNNGGAALFGYVAVSGMDTVSIVKVVAKSGGALALQSGPALPLKFDENNPDKKPLAVAPCAILQSSSLESDDETHRTEDSYDSAEAVLVASQDDGTMVAMLVNCDGESSTAATAASTIDMKCRVNDLTLQTNTPERFTVVAALQNKSISVVTLLHSNDATQPNGVRIDMSLVCTIDVPSQLGLNFPLMKSSLKFVQFIALDVVLLIAYDATKGQSHMNVGTLSSSTEGGHPSATLKFVPNASSVVDEGITCFAPIVVESASSLTSQAEASPPRGSLSASFTRCAATLKRASIPQHWLVGTVEGSVALVKFHKKALPPSAHQSSQPSLTEFQLMRQRPLKRDSQGRKVPTSVVRRNPALHEEPISSMAISPNGRVVISTDIAQKAVLSVVNKSLLPPSAGATTSAGSSSPSPREAYAAARRQWMLFGDLYDLECGVAAAASCETPMAYAKYIAIIIFVVALLFSAPIFQESFLTL